MLDDLASAPDNQTQQPARFSLTRFSGAVCPEFFFPKPTALHPTRMDVAATCRHFETTRRGAIIG